MVFLVGTAGFEPATSASRTLRAAKLRHVPRGDSLSGLGVVPFVDLDSHPVDPLAIHS